MLVFFRENEEKVREEKRRCGLCSPNMREACSGDGNKVILRNPGFPVLLKDAERSLIILQLAERVLINDRVVVRIDEDTWRDPRLY